MVSYNEIGFIIFIFLNDTLIHYLLKILIFIKVPFLTTSWNYIPDKEKSIKGLKYF